MTYPASRVEVETDLDNLISIFMISNFNVKTKSWNFSSDDVACFSLTFVEPDNAPYRQPFSGASQHLDRVQSKATIRQRWEFHKGPLFFNILPIKSGYYKNMYRGYLPRNSELMWE